MLYLYYKIKANVVLVRDCCVFLITKDDLAELLVVIWLQKVLILGWPDLDQHALLD